MKIIGVMGNPGSGKTTFTEYLEQKQNVGVIHVDDLVKEIKVKYFRPFLQSRKDASTDNHEGQNKPSINNITDNPNNLRVNADVKKFFYTNKLFFKMLMSIRSFLIRKQLDKQIEELKKAGKELIAIDDWALPTNKLLFKRCNHVYTIERDYLNRREGLKKRDNLTTKELKVYAAPYALGFIKTPVGDKYSVIKNNGTLEELYEKADKVLDRFGVKTFDEKYSLRGKVNAKTAVQKLGKLNSKTEYSQTK